MPGQDLRRFYNHAAVTLWRGRAGRVRSSAVAKAMADRPSGPQPFPWPYFPAPPCATHAAYSARGMKRSDAELMQ